MQTLGRGLWVAVLARTPRRLGISCSALTWEAQAAVEGEVTILAVVPVAEAVQREAEAAEAALLRTQSEIRALALRAPTAPSLSSVTEP